MTCQRCGTQLNPNSSFCTNCGAGASNATPFQPQYQAQYLPAAPKRNKKTIIIVASVIIGLIAATGIGIGMKVKMENDRRAAEAAAAQAAYEAEQAEIERQRNDYSWVPSGYVKFSEDYNLAYKGVGYEGAGCWNESCWGIRVVSNEYCSILSIDVDMDRYGTYIDSDTDVVYDVSPGDSFIMKFETYYSVPWDATVTDIYCS